MTYEVRQIVKGGETVLGIFGSLEVAMDDCVVRWNRRKAGGPVFAIRDAETEQRWSYADIKDYRREFGLASSPSDDGSKG